MNLRGAEEVRETKTCALYSVRACLPLATLPCRCIPHCTLCTCTLLDISCTHSTMHTANLSCTQCTLLSAAHTVQLSCTAEEGRPALHSDAIWCIQLQCAGSYSELQPCCSCSVVLQAAAPTISLSLALTVISLCTAQFPPHTGLQLEQGSSLHWVCSFK